MFNKLPFVAFRFDKLKFVVHSKGKSYLTPASCRKSSGS